jgi:hypothetical protein
MVAIVPLVVAPSSTRPAAVITIPATNAVPIKATAATTVPAPIVIPPAAAGPATIANCAALNAMYLRLR